MNKWLVVAFIVFFGGIGSYFLYLSHADSTQVPCVSIGSGKYNCTFYQLPTPIVNGSNASVGTFKYSHTNWIICQQTGREVAVGAYHNKWYGWTLSDQNTWGWVNAVYGQGGVNDGSYSAAPNCNGAHGAPPQPVVTAAPAPAPTSTIVAYTGNNDGCGGNATHYNGTIHVGQTNYGTGSVCKCNTGKVIAYGTPYQTTTPNPGCGTTTASSGSTVISPTPAPSTSTCSSGWYTTGSGGGDTYYHCVSGKWVAASCHTTYGATFTAVASTSSSGPCVSSGTARTSVTPSFCQANGQGYSNGHCVPLDTAANYSLVGSSPASPSFCQANGQGYSNGHCVPPVVLNTRDSAPTVASNSTYVLPDAGTPLKLYWARINSGSVVNTRGKVVGYN